MNQSHFKPIKTRGLNVSKTDGRVILTFSRMQPAFGRKYSATDFEGLQPWITVQVPSPPLNRAHQQQVDSLVRDARELLTPPERSPLHLPYLYNGSKFCGKQCSRSENSLENQNEYNVTVEIKEVDLSQDYLCGYLTIENLTTNYPTLTTFFEGEVIGGHSKHNFRTGHRWRSDAFVDLQYWRKFPAFLDFLEEQKIDIENDAPKNLDLVRPPNQITAPGLFMRWKEWFLVPDHRIEKIEGASYDGFYYMYYDKRNKRFEGYYYHDSKTSTDQYQYIELNYSEEMYSAYAAFR